MPSPAAETRHVAEYAKSGRAKCKRCKVAIAKGALRCGQSVFFQGIEAIGWRCFDCWNPPVRPHFLHALIPLSHGCDMHGRDHRWKQCIQHCIQ